MAPTIETKLVVIVPWPIFQAFEDGRPCIGGKLYSFQPNTSTPKSTWADPFFTSPNENPCLLDDQGKRTVYLQGLYRLRLFNADDELLWEVDSYQFDSSAPPPMPGDKIMGSTDSDIVPSPGAGVISIPSLVPAGYRCEGLTWTITTGFGTSNGLSGLLIGDAVANDRWARLTNVSAGQTGGQVNFRSDTVPVEPIPYVILVAAENGLFDATGAMHITAYWSALPADVP